MTTLVRQPVTAWMNTAITFFTGIAVLLGGAMLLHRYEVLQLPAVVYRTVTALFVIVFTYLVASTAIRLTVRVLLGGLSEVEPEQRILIGMLYSFVIYIIATLYLFWYFGLQARNITILIGLFTTGLAFALRDVLMTFLAWILILTKRPFRIGDYIKI